MGWTYRRSDSRKCWGICLDTAPRLCNGLVIVSAPTYLGNEFSRFGFAIVYALYVIAKIGGDGVGDVSPAFFLK